MPCHEMPLILLLLYHATAMPWDTASCHVMRSSAVLFSHAAAPQQLRPHTHRSSDTRRLGRCTCARHAECMASAAFMATSTSAEEACSAVQAAQGGSRRAPSAAGASHVCLAAGHLRPLPKAWLHIQDGRLLAPVPPALGLLSCPLTSKQGREEVGAEPHAVRLQCAPHIHRPLLDALPLDEREQRRVHGVVGGAKAAVGEGRGEEHVQASR